MKDLLSFTRRHLLALAGGAMLATGVVAPAAAQADFPNRPITFICAFPAGSGADTLVRYFANAIQQSTGHTIVVENKPGAAGTISAEFVARSEPDGYTVYVHSGFSTALNYSLWNNPAIDPRTDLMGVAGINEQPFYIVVGNDSPYQTIQDLNAYLLEAGEDATYGTSATSGRVLAAQFLSELGATPVEVPYSTAIEMVPDIASLALDWAATDPVTATVNAREGRIRILATGAGRRLSVAPDVPSLTEVGLTVDQTGVWAAYVPAGTSPEIIGALAEMFNGVMAMDSTQDFLRSVGGEPWIATPEEVTARMVANVEQGAFLVDLAGLPRN